MSILSERERNILDENVPDGTAAGIIGCGKFGSEVRKYLLGKGVEVLVCDPPRAERECEEEYDDVMAVWGNGMGGCVTERDSSDAITFLPLATVLARSGAIVLAVPEDQRQSVLESIEKSPFASHVKVLDFTRFER